MNVQAGDPAPDFTLPDADGRPVSLSSLRGRPVLVYFYPRDETPGCTTQACDIRDRWQEFVDGGVHVLGISPDTSAAHAAFRANHALPHTLLADPDREVLRAYGAWGTKKNYGREYEGVIRSSVLIDGDGRVVSVWKRVGAKQHAEQVLKAIAAL